MKLTELHLHILRLLIAEPLLEVEWYKAASFWPEKQVRVNWGQPCPHIREETASPSDALRDKFKRKVHDTTQVANQQRESPLQCFSFYIHPRLKPIIKFSEQSPLLTHTIHIDD